MAKITIDDLIGFVNNWDEEKIELYGGIGNLLKIIEKKGRLNDLDLESDLLEDIQDEIYWVLLNSNNPEVRKETYQRIKERVINNDLEFLDGNWYMVVESPEDLSEFFCSGWQSDSQSIVKGVLGDDIWEPFYETTDNVYRDVIGELNNQNLSILKERISSELVGEEVSVETDLLEQFYNTENVDGKLIITEDMIDDIIQDEETMLYLLKEYLYDINSDLISIHFNSFNSAYENDCYERIWKELETLFDGKNNTKWMDFERKTKKIYKFYVGVTRDIDHYIYKFLEINHKYGRYDQLSYQGSYSGVLKKLIADGDIDCLTIHLMDYPDYNRVTDYINENFKNYF